MDKSVKIAQVNELNFYLNWDYVKDVCNEAVRKENEQLKLIIKRTKASGNYPGRVSAYKSRIIHLSEENQQLKELLRECRDDVYNYQYIRLGTLTKIDNAIGEKK